MHCGPLIQAARLDGPAARGGQLPADVQVRRVTRTRCWVPPRGADADAGGTPEPLFKALGMRRDYVCSKRGSRWHLWGRLDGKVIPSAAAVGESAASGGERGGGAGGGGVGGGGRQQLLPLTLTLVQLYRLTPAASGGPSTWAEVSPGWRLAELTAPASVANYADVATAMPSLLASLLPLG